MTNFEQTVFIFALEEKLFKGTAVLKEKLCLQDSSLQAIKRINTGVLGRQAKML